MRRRWLPRSIVNGVADPLTRCNHKIHGQRLVDVRFAAHYGLKSDSEPFLKRATSRLTHRSKLQNYSINSSAWASNVGGSETERFGGLEVDRQFELYWGLNRKLALFVTPQDAI